MLSGYTYDIKINVNHKISGTYWVAVVQRLSFQIFIFTVKIELL